MMDIMVHRHCRKSTVKIWRIGSLAAVPAKVQTGHVEIEKPKATTQFL
jgi:hypothetical protein